MVERTLKIKKIAKYRGKEVSIKGLGLIRTIKKKQQKGSLRETLMDKSK